jgi:hypothetical protein
MLEIQTLRSKNFGLAGGTEGSNPAPSSGESSANLTSSIRCHSSRDEATATPAARCGSFGRVFHPPRPSPMPRRWSPAGTTS